MKDIWLKFGCFLTGYNYYLVLNSSEATAKFVKKNLSAFLVVSILWGFIGFSFAQRYMHLDNLSAIFMALIMVFIVIQIERQITMNIDRNKWAICFRIIIGVVMAVIGSLILDQIIFKDDIEKKNISLIQEEVNKVLPTSTKEIDVQILQLDSIMTTKNQERNDLIQQINAAPTLKIVDRTITTVADSINPSKTSTTTIKEVLNPKSAMLPAIDSLIKNLQQKSVEKQDYKINIREKLEKEIKSKRGFLDELKVLHIILLESRTALIVWILLLIFFIALEMFVLVNKLSSEQLDYDKMILHQVKTKIGALEGLGK